MIDGHLPDDTLHRLVRKGATPTTVYRQDNSGESTYGGAVSDSYSELTDPRDILLFNDSKRMTQTVVGDNIEGDLSGYILPSTDLQNGDRIDYGTERYEVAAMLEQPSPNDPTIVEVMFEHVGDAI